MKKFTPLTLLTVLLASCGGGGSLQTAAGGGLGSVDIALTQSAAPATNFKGTLTASMFGGNHPVAGDVVKGTLKTDVSSGTVNEAVAFTCSGSFTSNSYRGNCEMVKGGGTFVLVMSKK